MGVLQIIPADRRAVPRVVTMINKHAYVKCAYAEEDRVGKRSEINFLKIKDQRLEIKDQVIDYWEKGRSQR